MAAKMAIGYGFRMDKGAVQRGGTVYTVQFTERAGIGRAPVAIAGAIVIGLGASRWRIP
jgi:hypothetical protein